MPQQRQQEMFAGNRGFTGEVSSHFSGMGQNGLGPRTKREQWSVGAGELTHLLCRGGNVNGPRQKTRLGKKSGGAALLFSHQAAEQVEWLDFHSSHQPGEQASHVQGTSYCG